MGMANSDNERAIARDHARKQAMKDRPRSPATWDNPHPTEDQMAYYRHDLERWAANLPDDDDSAHWYKTDR